MVNNYNIQDFVNNGLVNYYNLNNVAVVYVGKRVFMTDKLNLNEKEYGYFLNKLREDIFKLLDIYLHKGSVNKIYLDIRKKAGKVSYSNNILYLTIEPEMLEEFLQRIIGIFSLEDIAFNVLEEDEEFVNKVIAEYNRKRNL